MLSLMFVIVFVPFVLSGSEPVKIFVYPFLYLYCCWRSNYQEWWLWSH